jgi:hypothetical protein
MTVMATVLTVTKTEIRLTSESSPRVHRGDRQLLTNGQWASSNMA